MNKLVFTFIALMGISGSVYASTLKDADAFFDKREFQAALSSYEPFLTSSDTETRYRALYRSCEAQALLYRYGEAVERLEKAKTSNVPELWRARFLLLQADLYRQYVKQYGYQQQSSDIEEGSTDITRRPTAQLHQSIRETYAALYPLASFLANRPLKQESYFVSLEKADLRFYPSLWDFALDRWTGYLLDEAPESSEEKSSRPRADEFLKEVYVPHASSSLPLKWAPVRLAAFLFDGKVPGTEKTSVDRIEAVEHWKVMRLQIPLRYPDKVVRSSPPTLDQEAAIEQLKKWMEGFTHRETHAEAGAAAADCLNTLSRFSEAMQLCREVARRFPLTDGAKRVGRLAASIELPVLTVAARPAPLSGRGAAEVTARNLKKVYARLYRTTLDELRESAPSYNKNNWSQSLNYTDDHRLKRFLNQKPTREWAIDISTPPYHMAKVSVDLPKSEAGLYFLIISNDDSWTAGESMLSGGVVNLTRLALFGSQGIEGKPEDFYWSPTSSSTRKASVFRMYALDAETGAPLPDVDVQAYLQDNGGRGTPESITLKSDSSGVILVNPLPVTVTPFSYSYYSFDPLAKWGANYAWWAQTLYWQFHQDPPAMIYVDTDRPIYRPGQQVQVKATVVRRLPQGYSVYGVGNLEVTLHDVNGQEVERKNLKLNAMGTAATPFKIPTGRLLGQYRVNARLLGAHSQVNGSGSFSVEEYKRPEYEVKLLPAAEPWRVNQGALIEGDARYYFGGPVSDATINYRILRERWAPPWFWWCRWFYSSVGFSQEEVAVGRVTTDAKGHFRIAFTPTLSPGASELENTARFSVHIDARDAGGRTISTSKAYTAGKSPVSFQISPKAGFFEAGHEGLIDLGLVTLDGEKVEGVVAWKLFRIDQDPAENTENLSGWRAPSLDQLFDKIPSGAEMDKGGGKCGRDKSFELRLKSLPAGVYRLHVSAKDARGSSIEQAIILLWADAQKGVPRRLPALAIPEHTEYVVGEKARFLIGASALTDVLHVETWSNNYLRHRQMLRGGGLRIIERSVRAENKGGMTVRWLGIRDYQPYEASAFVSVPWKDKELQLQWERFDEALKPAAKPSWVLSVRDDRGRRINGEALITMFDRSLEYYAQSFSANPSQLYATKPLTYETVHSRVAAYLASLPVNKGWVAKLLTLFQQDERMPLVPSLRSSKSQFTYSRLRKVMNGGGEGGVMMLSSLASADSLSVSVQGATRASAVERGAPKGEAPASVPQEVSAPVQARSNFAETALFLPQLPIKNGEGSFSFDVPEQLTSWKVSASVLTSDVKTGQLSRETVTRKDLMVRVDMPRFFREGDKGTVKVLVHNETDRLLTGTATLQIEGLTVSDTVREFKTAPHGMTPFSWSLEIPRGITTYKVRAIVRSNDLVDAEERELPILPSRQRLIESVVIHLDGTQNKKLQIPSFKRPDATRENESMVLQIDPQLALVILNSLPFLVQYPYECVEQTLNRFVPMAITHEIYKKHPAIAAAAAKIPKRSTITPPWDREDPRRLMTLMESPWVEEAGGIKSSWPVIDLFDGNTVDKQTREALDKLKAAQLSSGGFPWFPGGQEDPYITLYVLAGFAEAKRYGVAIPEEMVNRALTYVNNTIPRRLVPKEADLEMMLYAAWVVTSFGNATPEARQGFTFAKAWVDYADRHTDILLPLGRAYAAYVYYRLGEKTKAETYLTRALDGAREDATTGTYWTPEKNSWLWYSDTVEKHAFFIRTLQKWRPTDRRLSGMVQWLLFNRKANVWKSTKASAQAIYALLDVLQARGALDKGDRYDVKWDALQESVQVNAVDWIEKPIRWEKKGKAITPNAGEARIDKKGPGFAFASLTWIYSTDKLAEATSGGLMNLKRQFFLRAKNGDSYRLKPLNSGDAVAVGDQIEVHLTVNARSQFEYVHLKDPKAAGFEAEQLSSGWKWDQLSRYEEPRDSLTNFFMSWLPHGEYVLRYRLKPTAAGTYRLGAATLQSMYAPEFTAHSSGFVLKVKD